MNEKIMTAKEAAEFLGVTRSNVYHLIKVGRLVVENGYITSDSVKFWKSHRTTGRPIGSSRLKSPK